MEKGKRINHEVQKNRASNNLLALESLVMRMANNMAQCA
jgi:hypothetical protein